VRSAAGAALNCQPAAADMRCALPGVRNVPAHARGVWHGVTRASAPAVETAAAADLRLCARPPARFVWRAVKTLDRDSFMSPQQAKAWGVIDEVVTQRSETEVIDVAGGGGSPK